MTLNLILNPRTEEEEEGFQQILKSISITKEKWEGFQNVEKEFFQREEEVREKEEDGEEGGEGEESGGEFNGQEIPDSSDSFESSESSERENQAQSSRETELEDVIVNNSHPSHPKKAARVIQKIRKTLNNFPSLDNIKRRYLLAESIQMINTISPTKITKHTVNQTAGVILYYLVRQHKLDIQLDSILDSIKRTEKSNSRTHRPTITKGNSEALGISKLVQSLLPKKEDHSKSSLEATIDLCMKLNLSTDIQKYASSLSHLFSEDSSLASRHPSSISASCVFVASQKFHVYLTLSRVAQVSGVSVSTVRKAYLALKLLLKDKDKMQL